MKESGVFFGTAAALDVETTGFNADCEEILELAVTLFRYDRRSGRVLGTVGEYCGLREPSCRISLGASRVHGITRRTVRGLRLNCRRIRALLRQADFVVAHNAAFDRGFIDRLMPSFRTKTWLCSMTGIDWMGKGFTSRSLENLAATHEIENPRPHRANGDVATLLTLLAHQPRRRRPYLYELLRNAGFVGGRQLKV